MEKSGLTPYNFYEVGLNQFEFITKENLLYSVYFFPAKQDYFSKYPSIPDNIFLFGFDLLTKTDQRIKFDSAIALTLISILKDFFKNQSNAIIYLCNVSDNRQRQRKITFNKWFKKYNIELSFEKTDREIIIDSENEYYVSLVFHKQNPDKEKYILAFTQMADELHK